MKRFEGNVSKSGLHQGEKNESKERVTQDTVDKAFMEYLKKGGSDMMLFPGVNLPTQSPVKNAEPQEISEADHSEIYKDYLKNGGSDIINFYKHKSAL